MAGREPVEIDDVTVEAETDMALGISVDDEEVVWIPKSQILEDSEVTELGDRGTLVLPEWLAIEKGLI